jgi:iron complex outermembrane recepter protein
VPIDPLVAERVEVIRGPGVLRYGSQAIGGVVAVENNRVPTTVPQGGFTARVTGGASSVDRGRDGGFAVTAGAGNFVIHADGFARATKDYNTPQGRQFNTFSESEGFALGGSYVWSRGFVGIGVSRTTSLYGIPGPEAIDKRPRIDLEQTKVYSKGEWRAGVGGIEALRFWLGTSRYAHNEVIEDMGADIIGTRFTNREREARLEAQHVPVRTALGELRGAVGLHWSTKTTRGFGVDEPVDGILDPAAHQRMLGMFVFEELQLTPKLRLQGAARLEGTRSSGIAVDDPVPGPLRQRRHPL